MLCRQREAKSLNWLRKKRHFSNVAESIEVMLITRIWILLSVLIVVLLRLSRMEQETAGRDISAKIVIKLSVTPMAPLPFAPSCLLVNGLSLSS